MPPDAFGPPPDEPQHVEVFEENWPTLLVFLDCVTQWRRELPGMATEWYWHGLRYSECALVIRSHGHAGKRAAEIFRSLQVMERAALPILNTPGK